MDELNQKTDKIIVEFRGSLKNDIVDNVVTTVTAQLKEPVEVYSLEYEQVFKSIINEIQLPVLNYPVLLEYLKKEDEK